MFSLFLIGKLGVCASSLSWWTQQPGDPVAPADTAPIGCCSPFRHPPCRSSAGCTDVPDIDTERVLYRHGIYMQVVIDVQDVPTVLLGVS